MKKIFITAGMLCAGFFFAQEGNIGINTNEPGATLDVNISANITDATKGQGVAVPRVSKERLAQMTDKIVTSSLVYVDREKNGDTNFNDTTLTATVGSVNRVAKVDAVGFYYFDGSQWSKLNAGSTSWEEIRNPSTGVFTQTTNSEVIPSNAFFVIGNQSQIRLPKMIDDSVPSKIKALPNSNGKMILIFKSGTGNISVLDHNGVASGTAGAYIDGTSSITSSRGKQFIWNASTMKWYPIGY